MTARWDIFCKVVDNYGDVGVCWRLARELATDHGLDVTLAIDDLRTLEWMAPGVDRARAEQTVSGVAIRRWTEATSIGAPADVVIEAFGCGLPEAYASAMAKCARPPVWFVLEYLSAEAWIDGAHGLPSPHPRLPIVRRFWFPGFTLSSGGLLRERGLIEARDAFQRDERLRETFWSSLAMPAPVPGESRISLFCYPNPALPALFDAWADGEDHVTCIVPEGVATGALDAWTGGDVPHAGHPVTHGRLELHAVPFLSQDDYDRLLWACDVNFVRGEDSFVRAQWAARPFAWHIYPQPEDAHRRKLDAFVDRYVEGLDDATGAAARRFFGAWNGVPAAGAINAAWLQWTAMRPHLARHGRQWIERLLRLPELASGLVKAARNAL
ncbi:MAG TPA: elongation factor P maturation arginine rhamnosyltransferase EarP [Casimicrobiaceae bacterium]